MGIFDLLKNTVEGVAETTVNAAKLAASPLAVPFDEGKAVSDSMEGISKGVEKIGNSAPPNPHGDKQ